MLGVTSKASIINQKVIGGMAFGLIQKGARMVQETVDCVTETLQPWKMLGLLPDVHE